MQLITLADADSPHPQPPADDPRDSADAAAAHALAGLIASVGDSDFARQGLAHIDRWLPACWWSIYRLFDDAPPLLHATACCGVPDGTMRSWQVYRASLYRFDDTFGQARAQLRQGRPGIVHLHASEIGRRHRDAIYSRHALHQRLSLVQHDAQGGLLAVNFYRHESQPGFSQRQIDSLRRFGLPLLACVERHNALVERAVQPATLAEPAAPDVLAALTRRERQVCQRLLKGWTHDGIAADLGVSPTTVKTYRDRAFDRLGIHHRNELFALALGTLEAAAAPVPGALPS